jgi:MIP family channel proteins
VTTVASKKTGQFGSDSSKGVNRFRNFLIETGGTATLVYAIAGSACLASQKLPIAGTPFGSMSVPIVGGVVLLVLVFVLGPHSGAHLNPAVTVGLASTGDFPWSNVPLYICAQMLGGTIGGCLVWLSIPYTTTRSVLHLGASSPATIATNVETLVMEIFFTAFLVAIVRAVGADEDIHIAVSGLAVGGALFVGILIAGPVSGGALNPARAIGPMIPSLHFHDWHLYVISGLVGGVLGAQAHKAIVAKAKKPEDVES